MKLIPETRSAQYS